MFNIKSFIKYTILSLLYSLIIASENQTEKIETVKSENSTDINLKNPIKSIGNLFSALGSTFDLTDEILNRVTNGIGTILNPNFIAQPQYAYQDLPQPQNLKRNPGYPQLNEGYQPITFAWNQPYQSLFQQNLQPYPIQSSWNLNSSSRIINNKDFNNRYIDVNLNKALERQPERSSERTVRNGRNGFRDNNRLYNLDINQNNLLNSRYRSQQFPFSKQYKQLFRRPVQLPKVYVKSKPLNITQPKPELQRIEMRFDIVFDLKTEPQNETKIEEPLININNVTV